MGMRKVMDIHVGFNTQPPKGGWPASLPPAHFYKVSTHSRLKAAGSSSDSLFLSCRCFNTQPPKGGWVLIGEVKQKLKVSTHSRLKAAGTHGLDADSRQKVSTHSRLKAAGYCC